MRLAGLKEYKISVFRFSIEGGQELDLKQHFPFKMNGHEEVTNLTVFNVLVVPETDWQPAGERRNVLTFLLNDRTYYTAPTDVYKAEWLRFMEGSKTPLFPKKVIHISSRPGLRLDGWAHAAVVDIFCSWDERVVP